MVTPLTRVYPWVYCQYSPSSKEDDLERNVLTALESVLIETITM